MKTFKTTAEIQAERLAQRSNKTIYNLLGVLLGELDRRPSQNTPVTEEDIYKVIKKLYDAAIECSMVATGPVNEEEITYLKEYIRTQLTETQLREIIEGLKKKGFWDIGECMKHLQANYAGQYDGKKASAIIREVLNMP